MPTIWKRTFALAAPTVLAAAMMFPYTAAQAQTRSCASGNSSQACNKAATTAKGKTPSTTQARTSRQTTARPAAASSAKSSAKSTARTQTARTQTATTRTASARTGATAARSRPAAQPVAARAASRPVAVARAASVSVATTAAAASVAPLMVAANTSRAEAAALRSNVAYVQDLETSTVLFSKNERVVAPIASISKLMTALVVVDANQPLDEVLEITSDDIDRLRHAPSRLTVGTRLTRADMLHLALMSSENRAANALGRHYPGGLPAFARAMNAKARALGMYDTHFVEPTGLSSENVSTPRDLVRLIRATGQRPLIHRYSTDTEKQVRVGSGRVEMFRNTNLLVRRDDWDIKVSKTGFINEAGECLVMMARMNGRDVAIVLLNSQGKLSRIGDAVRLRNLLQKDVAML